VNLPPEIDTKLMVPKAIVAKVAYVPGTAFYADGFGSWAMRLSYCHPTPDRIREGVKALGGVVKQEIARRSSGFEITE
jgi:DNA-binding transcriptional MocR family regulator